MTIRINESMAAQEESATFEPMVFDIPQNVSISIMASSDGRQSVMLMPKGYKNAKEILWGNGKASRVDIVSERGPELVAPAAKEHITDVMGLDENGSLVPDPITADLPEEFIVDEAIPVTQGKLHFYTDVQSDDEYIYVIIDNGIRRVERKLDKRLITDNHFDFSAWVLAKFGDYFDKSDLSIMLNEIVLRYVAMSKPATKEDREVIVGVKDGFKQYAKESDVNPYDTILVTNAALSDVWHSGYAKAQEELESKPFIVEGATISYDSLSPENKKFIDAAVEKKIKEFEKQQNQRNRDFTKSWHEQ